jgi:hypothetical protein
LSNSRDKRLLLQACPSNKRTIRVVQLLGVKNRNFFLGENWFNFGFKRLPRVYASYITGDGRNGILRVFPAIIEITDKHEYATSRPKCPTVRSKCNPRRNELS